MSNKLLVTKILVWYGQHGRLLPWRSTNDPYCILVSEVMLQQTQVSRVIEKYNEFLKAFPTVHDLAKAKTADVIRAWKGLGYNRRALFLQRTAQAVVEQYGRKFPKDVTLLKKLPGIGEYTARAVLCFAFKKDVAVLDTNHRKFYSRVFGGGLSDKELLIEADGFIENIPTSLRGARATRQSTTSGQLSTGLLRSVVRNDVGSNVVYDWNQALMDFVSATERGESDETIDWFNAVYPPQQLVKNNVKKKVIPFKQTDRYIRGQIIDILRAQKSTSVVLLQEKFVEFPKERVEKVVLGLIKDGLIKREKRGIVLP